MALQLNQSMYTHYNKTGSMRLVIILEDNAQEHKRKEIRTFQLSFHFSFTTQFNHKPSYTTFSIVLFPFSLQALRRYKAYQMEQQR